MMHKCHGRHTQQKKIQIHFPVLQIVFLEVAKGKKSFWQLSAPVAERGEGGGYGLGCPPSIEGGLGGLPLENFCRINPKWCNFTYF